MRIFDKLFGDKEADLIEKKFGELQDRLMTKYEDLKSENANLKSQIEGFQRIIEEKNQTIYKQNSEIREKNEADLFLECEKIKARILKGEKLADIDLRAFNQMNAIAQQQNTRKAYAGVGLGGIIGGAANGIFR